jgi:hypothetical protein
VIGVILIGFAGSVLLAQDTQSPADNPAAIGPENQPEKNPRVRVSISKETTWITEPLREDGSPDYVRYLDEKLAEGVTPDNNAAVLLLRTFGPRELAKKSAGEYFKRLGIEPLPVEGDYFVDWSVFCQRFSAKEWPAVPKGDGRDAREYFASLDEEARKRPWTQAEFPHIAKWLDANNRHIDQMVAASKRPRMYTPLISNEENQTLVMVLLPLAQHNRQSGRALVTRAMYRAGNGDVEGAIADVMACHRLARLTGQGFTLVEGLIAIAVDHLALDAQGVLIAENKLSAGQRAALRKQLAELPPIRKMAQTLDQGERLMFLDTVAWMARDLTGATKALGAMNDAPAFFRGILDRASKSAFDWDLILKNGNSWYDRLVKIAGIEDRKEQLKELAQFDDDAKQLGASAKTGRLLLQGLIAPRETVSRQIADALLALLMPAVEAALKAERRNLTRHTLVQLGFSLADYQDEHKAFPDRLDALAPKYLEKIPLDPMWGEPYVYKKTAGGYVLYSLGHNGKDDGGQTSDANDGSDDLVVSVPGTD